MEGVADRDGQRVGRIRPRRHSQPGNMQADPCGRPGASRRGPTPTTVFFTALGAYSATGKPALRPAPAIAMPRACPSFEPFRPPSRFTKVCSTAAASGGMP